MDKEKEIFEEFKKRANPNNNPKLRLNKGTFALFRRLVANTNYDFKYAIADEIIANRKAIMSLDEHIKRLMSDRNYLMQELNELKIALKRM